MEELAFLSAYLPTRVSKSYHLT